MHLEAQQLITTQQLAKRWGRSESAISLASAVGTGPRYVKVNGSLRYPVEEIQRYERACLFFDPAEMALQSVA